MLPSTEAIFAALVALGIPVVLLLFYLDGMIVGKFAPPGALYVAYVALSTPSNAALVPVAVGCVVASTLGQWTIYRGFNEESPEFFGIRRRVPHADRVPLVVKDRIGDRRMRIVTRLFERFGGPALAVTNVVPGVRSLMAIPAGLSGYPRWRFLALATVGNAVYLGLLTAVARGLVNLAGLLPGP